MVDIAAIASAYEGLKAAKHLFEGFIESKVDLAAQAKIQAAVEQVGKAQHTLYELRDELFSIQQKNEELRRALDAIDAWKETSSAYALAKTDGGAVVYKYNSDPLHYACPSCYNKKQIQILQDNRTISGKFRCTGCAAEFPINPAVKVKPEPIRYPGGGFV